ncbi:hypothetical protein [Klebsiella pneumoniae]|uniref:hypothetical protein n=1 Tax=Klebsiella pneumoniae TaxID=573 RepID=UPI002D79BF51|nr:hypothetical protein [Klebsiella pneumoniae]
MDSVHHIWCPLSSQEFQDLPDGAETTLTTDVAGDVFCGQAESTLRIQVDVWAETNDEARALRLDALARLQVLSPVEVTKIPGYDTTTHLHRATLEITVIA